MERGLSALSSSEMPEHSGTTARSLWSELDARGEIRTQTSSCGAFCSGRTVLQ
jgi:hypothetical protein